MKIFVFEGNHPRYNIAALFSLSNQGDAPLQVPRTALLTLPDTALLTRGRPLFVPDEAWPCLIQAHLVVRISRLGRHIAARFAHRYYDAVTVGTTCTARALLEQLRREGLPWELSRAFDGAASIGQWQEVAHSEADDHAPAPADREVRLDINGRAVQRFRTGELLEQVDRQIEAVSRFYKLCQGDLIFTGTDAPGTEVHIDDHIDGLADGHKLLSFNIK